MALVYIELEQEAIELEVLTQSPLFRLACIVIDLAVERGSIPLTQKLAFKRDFVAETFNLLSWPNCDAELFGPQVVRNEHTFGLLEVLHDVLIDLRIGDRAGRRFFITEGGKSLRTRAFDLFYSIFPHYFFRINHTYYRGLEDGPERDWPKILGTIHRVQDGISFHDLCLEISGHRVRLDAGKDLICDDLDIGVLRPLCWSGLLEQSFVRTDFGYEYRYRKTALWYQVFVLSWLEEHSIQ